MCISKVSEKPFRLKKENGEYVGWKVFIKDAEGELRGELYSSYKIRPRGQWLDANDYNEIPWVATSPGWHVLLLEKDAKTWCGDDNESCVIQKVYFKEPLVYGWQVYVVNIITRAQNLKTIITQEILILPVIH